MKRMIIEHKDFILKVNSSENNTTIFDSYKVSKSSDMKSIIKGIRTKAPKNYAINKRSIFGMINEWRVHNLLYSFGIKRDRTKDVDLDTEQPWYMKVAYFILSTFYFNF